MVASVDRLLRIIDTQNEIVRSRMSFSTVAQRVAELAQTIVPSMGAVVEVVDGDDMLYRAATGIAAPFLGTRLARSSSLSGLCVKLATPLNCTDTRTDPRVDRAACEKLGILSMIVVPLFDRRQAVGVLKVLSGDPNSFTEEDVETIGLLAGVIGACMGHATRHEQVEYASQHDILTGLPNRRAFKTQLESEIARYVRYQTPFSLAIVDLDGFKEVNDTHGHQEGDKVLVTTATLLKHKVRESDFVARTGGDEFALLLPSTKADAGETLLKRLQDQLLLAGVKCSYGVVDYMGENPTVFVDIADRKMYELKAAQKAVK